MADKGLIIQRRPDGSKFIYNFLLRYDLLIFGLVYKNVLKTLRKNASKYFFFIFKNHVIEILVLMEKYEIEWFWTKMLFQQKIRRLLTLAPLNLSKKNVFWLKITLNCTWKYMNIQILIENGRFGILNSIFLTYFFWVSTQKFQKSLVIRDVVLSILSESRCIVHCVQCIR